MTALSEVDHSTVISLLLLPKASRAVRIRTKLDNHCITVLAGCYLYSLLVVPEFTLNAISLYVGYYNSKRLKAFMVRLVSNNYLTLSGNKYKITAAGIDAVKEISIAMDQLVYEFCNKYDIVL